MNVPTPDDKDSIIPQSKSLPTQGSPKATSLMRRRKSTGDTASMGVYFFHTRKVIDSETNKAKILVEKMTPEELAVIPNKEAVPDDDAIPTLIPTSPTQNKSKI